MKYGQNYDEICQLFKETGFRRRGMAFFRIVGDGVLEVIKYHYRTRPWQQEYICVGIFSMYGEMIPQWLTASGCIPQYQVRWLDKTVKDRWISSISGDWLCQKDIDETHTWQIDIPFLKSKVIPFLDGIDTQSKAVDAMMYLDVEAQEVYGRHIIWNDALKFAPFLYTGDYENARKVIRSILAQHDFAISSNKRRWTTEQFQQYMLRYEPEAQKLQFLLRLTENRNPEEINRYLKGNYENNLILTRFMRKP